MVEKCETRVSHHRGASLTGDHDYMKRLHLICNAHLDPVWLWEWEEGAAEALSTFRTAADLCEEFDDFVFNHNEAILYEWVERYEPTLFGRIQNLVKTGRWHVMGGWYLQPDCNMPSGESFVRQMLYGRRYFAEKFGVRPTTAINFDSFGHTRGLVQILTKAGYTSYIHCRPRRADLSLPADYYTWVGYDGSAVIAARVEEHYNSKLGAANRKVEDYLKTYSDHDIGLVLWGVGNHGGGPSRMDLRNLRAMMSTASDVTIRHSRPEDFFADLNTSGGIPRHERDLNSWAPGCYTTQIRVKQLYRKFENEYFMTEKMLSAAALLGLVQYSSEDTKAALQDLLTAQFHDILPGSSIQTVEEDALRLMGHGIETCRRLRRQAFFSLCSGQAAGTRERIPILVYNPHPYPVTTVVECEFNLPDAIFDEQFTVPRVERDGSCVPSQAEQEMSNLNLDWRKRVVFQATLEPTQVNRFDCRLEVLPRRPSIEVQAAGGYYSFQSENCQIAVNAGTGLIDRYRVHGVDYLSSGAFQLVAIRDNEDPWGTNVDRFTHELGRFSLLNSQDSAWLAAVRKSDLPPVRVVEDGPVRAVVEACFGWQRSYAVVSYKIPKAGAEIEVNVRVFWNEKDTMLKLRVPTPFASPTPVGQVAYGVDTFPDDGKEIVAQRWMAIQDSASDRMLTCVNSGTYGADFQSGELRLSLLRSAAYSAHPILNRELVAQDRFSPRIDQGERQYRFWLQGGPVEARWRAIDRDAMVHNEAPMSVSFFPSGDSQVPGPAVILEDDVVQMTALKCSEDGVGFIMRLFEPTGHPRRCAIAIPSWGVRKELPLGPFEIVSVWLDDQRRQIETIDLLEQERHTSGQSH